MTKLEKVVDKLMCSSTLPEDAPQSEKQKFLDSITPAVLRRLEANDIVQHSAEVYSATASEYAKNPHTKDIVDELLQFMDMLPEGVRVLDVGCGPGRDSFFMSTGNEAFRKEYMGRMKNGVPTRERIPVPQKIFTVTAIDNSPEMLELCRKQSDLLVYKKGLLTPKNAPDFCYEDMHIIYDREYPGYYRNFDGVWSCTALFTHTPVSLLAAGMEAISRVLKSGGLFFTSYTNGTVDGHYDKLLASSTGRIKYFSHPNPEVITILARKYGMILVGETFSDYEIKGKIIKTNLFVSQFFRKA